MKHPAPSSAKPCPLHLSLARFAPLALATAATACASEDSSVEILYTEYGIAHLRASDYESLGYANGYAQARDSLCDIELGMLGLRAQLSRYFGPEGPSNSMAGSENSLGSDLYYQGLIDRGVVERLALAQPPLGPRPEVLELVRGYVRGFNRLLAEAPPVDCIDAEWIRPMAEIDVYRKAHAVATFVGQGMAAGALISAEPPNASSDARGSVDPTLQVTAHSQRSRDRIGRPGSNAVALGRDVTATGYGMNVANPHLKWDGDMRWWQAQLTIDGQLDVSGAGVIGLPLIAMGHTESVAFSVTMAEETQHFALFELELVDGSPTSYLVDGEAEAMLRKDVKVQVKRPDGSLETVSKAQWWTRYGPVMGPEFGLPWTAGGVEGPGRAFVFADPNAGNLRVLDTWFGFNHARDVHDVLAAVRETQGVPWWTVIAADAQGETLFSQIQVVANVPDEHLERCLTPLGRALNAGPDRRIILDGSRSECAWQTDADAVEPGIMGPGTLESPRMPVLFSSGYVANSNSSHWMPNASDRITGMPRIIGDEGTERSIRTRHTFRAIEEQLARGPFTREAMQDLVLSNRSEAAELAAEDTLAMCRSSATGHMTSSDGHSIDTREACRVLASWDREMNAGSRGALLFDRYWRRALELAAADGRSLWTLPFDPRDAIATPAELNVESGIFERALADATAELAALQMSLSAPLGEHQFVVRGGAHIPLGGGSEELGVFNIVHAPWAPESGYAGPFDGSTYLHVVSFDGTECPDTVTLLSYSQSDEPASPHHSDQTQLYSEQRWVTGRFCRSEILASPELQRIILE